MCSAAAVQCLPLEGKVPEGRMRWKIIQKRGAGHLIRLACARQLPLKGKPVRAKKTRQFYQNCRAFLVEARGVDLPCGAGRVAALGRPRRPIHYRSRSTPHAIMTKGPPARGEPFIMVEARGVEPLSENASKGTSPGADACCGTGPFPLPAGQDVKPAGQVA